MHKSKRLLKEQAMIQAAEVVFSKVGFKNAKMEDIANEAGITKVTLYSYFQSKENLYLATTFNAVQLLNSELYRAVDKCKDKNGLDSIMIVLRTFMEFCENNYFATETYLDYFSLLRSSADKTKGDLKLTDALKESIYFIRLRDIHNIGFKLAAKEIIKGQSDGSINLKGDPMLYTLVGWTTVLGYIKVYASSGVDGSPIFRVNLKDLKETCIDMMRNKLTSDKG